MPLRAIALNCSLKSSGDESSTGRLLAEVAAALRALDTKCQLVRVADLDIKPGVTSNAGKGDQWPPLRKRILASDIVILGTPIWLGQPSSVCKRVLERMDAFLSETDKHGRMVSYGTVAAVAVVGNEDGAHHVSAELYQALNDVGFSLAPNAVTYWVGEAMGSTDYKDVRGTPDKVAKATAMLARNAVHLAQQLKTAPYPGED